MILLRGDLHLPLCLCFSTIGCSVQAEMAEGLCRRPVTFPPAPLERFHWRKQISLSHAISETALQWSHPWRNWAALSSLRNESFPKPFESGGSGQHGWLLPLLPPCGRLTAAGKAGKSKTHLGSNRQLLEPPENSRFELKAESTLNLFEVVQWK